MSSPPATAAGNLYAQGTPPQRPHFSSLQIFVCMYCLKRERLCVVQGCDGWHEGQQKLAIHPVWTACQLQGSAAVIGHIRRRPQAFPFPHS